MIRHVSTTMYMYCHKDTKLDYMFRLTSSHHQVYTGEYKNHTGFFLRVRTGSHDVYNYIV